MEPVDTPDTSKPDTSKEVPSLEALIRERRNHIQQSSGAECQPERWGLALSGGGIRSATFCYGLITALAKAKVFWRFDLMSTVSGGGYIGSMVGRMAQTTASAEQLQNQLGEEDSASHHRKWLRANSRYLTPRGSRDLLFVIVTFLRNLAGVHLELGCLGLLLGCALAGVDLLAWWLLDLFISHSQAFPTDTSPLQVWNAVSPWPTLWLALPIPVLWAAGAATWYWYLPAANRTTAQTDSAWHRVTDQLAIALWIGAAIVLLGAIDWIAWHIAKKPYQLFWLAGGLTAILAALRTLLPLVQQGGRSVSELIRQRLPMLLDLAGKFGLLVMATFWTSVVHALTTHRVWDANMEQVDFVGAAYAVGILASISLAWILISGRNLDFLNRSSLHNFYRARLTRAYLGAANPEREHDSKVTQVHAADDVQLNQYTPHAKGGPVHIINVCINQTYQRHGLHNLDRQGELMSLVGPGLYQVSGKAWHALKADARATLGAWMAISGAAAAPGLGSATRPGLATLLTTLGVRLGYWWNTADKERSQPWYSSWLPKYTYLLSELLARFSGSDSRIQYLSDGGHSENTAAFPLLAARCKLIMLADCGSDPDYQFQDLENLIRRARIDLNVEIRFVKPAHQPVELFGSLDDLASPTHPACLALARVDYPGDDVPGVLVLVKPNLTTGLPEDIYNYSRDYPAFPQETTADQFFDEAQWESYFSLGCHLGKELNEKTLLSLTEMIQRGCGAVTPSAPNDETATSPQDDETPPSAQRRPGRIGVKSAAAAGLGISAIASAASAFWLALQNVSADSGTASRIDVQSLRPLYDTYAMLSLDPNSKTADEYVGRMAAQLMTTWRTVRANKQETLVLDNNETLDMLRTTYSLCQPLSHKLAVCKTLLDTFECPKKPAPTSAVSQNFGYWARHDPTGSPRLAARANSSYCQSTDSVVSSQQLAVATVAPQSKRQEQQRAALAVAAASRSKAAALAKPESPKPAAETVTQTKAVESAPTAVAMPQPEVAAVPESEVPALAATAEPEPTALAAPEAEPAEVPPPESDTSTSVPSVAAAPAPQPESVPADEIELSASEAPTPDKSADPVCKGITLYTQIYGPAGRDNVRTLRSLWRTVGASVPPIEDVLDSARRQGRSGPAPYSKPTVIYHLEDAKACAESLATVAFQPAGSWDVMPLNKRLSRLPRSVEVWLPPVAVAAGFDQWASNYGFCYQQHAPNGQDAPSYSVHCYPSQAACAEAQDSNPGKRQSACMGTELTSNENNTLLPFSGWAGSRYNLDSAEFKGPFPPLSQ